MTEAAAAHVRALLADRAFIFDNPASYMAGVDEALRAGRTPSATIGATYDGIPPSHPLPDGRGEE